MARPQTIELRGDRAACAVRQGRRRRHDANSARSSTGEGRTAYLPRMVDDLAERVRSLRLDYALEHYLDDETPAIEQWTVNAVYPDRDNRDSDGEPNLEC